jgi:Icc-related predicted phosphoesterase
MEKLIIDVLSDTHGWHKKCECEGGDIILHAGDASSRGTRQEMLNFFDWYGKQKYDHRIFVPGNHDWECEDEPEEMKKACEENGIILLNDSGVTVKGVKIWGSAVQPTFCDWAFNRDRGPKIQKHWDLIPKDTEVLITHGPPAGILDMTTYASGDPREGVGCDNLLKTMEKLNVRLHVFGHIHEARGITYKKETTYINAAFLDRMYYPQAKRPIRAQREVVVDGSIVYLADE